VVEKRLLACIADVGGVIGGPFAGKLLARIGLKIEKGAQQTAATP
jgi:hypothetical protein